MAYLIPTATTTLGPGGHLKMHCAVEVDSAAPDGALKIRDDGFILVAGLIVDNNVVNAKVFDGGEF
ncbi:MAG: hypothetical protein WCH05_09870 [Chlorobiaceae bacterium]|jgi:hypothetical protein